MERLKRIRAIIEKDFIESFKNRTVLIVILLPVLASLLFAIVDNNEMDRVFNIGIIEVESYSFTEFLNDVDNLKSTPFENEKKGIQSLESGQIDGFIIYDSEFKVYLDSSQSLTYFFLKDNLEDLIAVYLEEKPDYDLEFIPVNTTISKLSFLPIWITITATMIGVLIISGGFAEEKENKTLYSIIISPASKIDILLGKGIFGVLFTFLTIFIMGLLNGIYMIGFSNIFKLVITIIIASVSFTSIGLLIGSYTDSQSSARSIGTIIYFPLLFPMLIADLSSFTRLFARLFPTYYLHSALEKLLIFQGQVNISVDLVFLLGFALVLSTMAFFKFRKVN
ncbi:MAG: ABC transporter permease [Halanaerobiales bacterium]